MTDMTVTNANGSDYQAMIEEMARLKAENEKLRIKAQHKASLTFKVSEKGAVSIYGMGRFPVTLYASQFDRLAKQWGDLVDFVEENRHRLTTKD